MNKYNVRYFPRVKKHNKFRRTKLEIKLNMTNKKKILKHRADPKSFKNLEKKIITRIRATDEERKTGVSYD